MHILLNRMKAIQAGDYIFNQEFKYSRHAIAWFVASYNLVGEILTEAGDEARERLNTYGRGTYEKKVTEIF